MNGNELQDRWVSQWPAHCRACGGWGGATFFESHGMPYGFETLFDPCDNCIAADDPRCGRCSFPMTIEQAENDEPCTACGWNCDDGMPEVDPFDDEFNQEPSREQDALDAWERQTGLRSGY